MTKEQKTPWGYLGVPGLLSMASLGAGWLAITFLLHGLPFLAIDLAIVAFYLDCFDGYVARKTGQTSEFGRQLDGMFDFFNYLVFSAILFWRYIVPNHIGIIIGFIILATGAFRLVRFNIEGLVIKKGELYYAGIVVCHVSLTVIILFFLRQFNPQFVTIIAIPIMLAVSILQISRIHIKKSNTYWYWLTLALFLLFVSVGLNLWIK